MSFTNSLFSTREIGAMARKRDAPSVLELVETELRLAKWKVSEGFENLSQQEVKRLCQVRTQFVKARNLMQRRQNTWRTRCQQEQPLQNLIQINPYPPFIRRGN